MLAIDAYRTMASSGLSQLALISDGQATRIGSASDTNVGFLKRLFNTDASKKLNIDVFVVGDDWTGKYDYLKDLGVTVFYFPYGDGVSSTKIKEEVLRNYQDLKSKVETRVNPDVKVKE